jgi:uncharacterized protein (DUF1684 family)
MRFPSRFRVGLPCALCLASFLAPVYRAQVPSAVQDLSAWRAQHAAELQKPDGWLSLAGLEWLAPGDNSVGSAADNKIHLPASGPAHIGILRLQGAAVTLLAPPDGFPEGLLIDGNPAQPQELKTGADTDKGNPRITVGTLNFYAVRRGDRFALRIKDAKSTAMLGFHGLNWYPPNPNYRVNAKWIPYDPPRNIKLVTLIDTSYELPVPGVAVFTLDGHRYSLEPVVEDHPAKKLFFILRDLTSTTRTYGACRFLYTALPSNGVDQPGELLLDFNQLENPPCAYTPYTTCPLPPQGNRLPVALPVGELRYHQ